MVCMVNTDKDNDSLKTAWLSLALRGWPLAAHMVWGGLFLAVLLGLAHVTLGLKPIGILQSVAAFALLPFGIIWMRNRCGSAERFGFANGITLIRALGVCLLFGFISLGLFEILDLEINSITEAQLWFVASLIGACLALDGVDGWIARKLRQETAFGALFDQETDAAMIMIAALLVWQADKAGVWVLIAGALRYVFVLAGLFLPWLSGALFPSFRRKLACVVQVGALIFALVPILGRPITEPVAAMSVVFLLLSFLVDTVWLYRNQEKSD